MLCRCVISNIYPAACDPNGSWQLPGSYIYDLILSPPSNPHKDVQRTAVKVGKPFLLVPKEWSLHWDSNP